MDDKLKIFTRVFWNCSKIHRGRICHMLAYACDFKIAQNSKRNWVRCKNDSNFELSQKFQTEKVRYLKVLTRGRFFEQKLKRNEIVRILSFLKITCIYHHVTNPPSMSFWAISKYPPFIQVSVQEVGCKITLGDNTHYLRFSILLKIVLIRSCLDSSLFWNFCELLLTIQYTLFFTLVLYISDGFELSGSVKNIFRIKRSFGLILAIFGHFCRTENARISVISWTDIGSVWPHQSIFRKIARFLACSTGKGWQV